MYYFLGEIDCESDLGDLIGMEKASQVFKGKLNYFLDLGSGNVFGASDYFADSIFESGEVVN